MPVNRKSVPVRRSSSIKKKASKKAASDKPSTSSRNKVAPAAPVEQATETRAPRVPVAGYYAGASGGMRVGVFGGRRAARTLRRFSEQNVWTRVAIGRRRREISGADWSIIRSDNPKAQPDSGLVRAAEDLFTFVNAKGESLPQLLGILVEDLLVIDAGCCEIERTLKGDIFSLWPVPGEEIAPDPAWDGSDKKAPRYYQVRNGKVVAQYRDDEFVYMMANPRSNSVVGLSPLEYLMDTVEADLYGEDFEFQRMRETAPAGILYLGGGIPPEKVDAFRDQWEQDIAGTRDVSIMGGGGFDPETGLMTSPPTFIPFSRSARDEQRREYMNWLATKIAAAFEMDKMVFGLSESVHRSVGETLQRKTDQGLIGLAKVIESYITRRILWTMDPSHKHKFQFMNLVPRDALQEAKVRQIYMTIGCTTPNEIRSEDGKDPVPWGNEPFPMVTAKAMDPAQDEGPQSSEDVDSSSKDQDPKDNHEDEK